MTLPWPEWLPQWAQALVLIVGLVFAVLWMLVPFAVIGVKGRLDALAVQIDDLQAELRVMAMSSNSAAIREEAEGASGEPLSEVLRTQDRARDYVQGRNQDHEDPDRTGAAQAAHARPARMLDPEDPQCDIPAYERRASPPAADAPPAATVHVADGDDDRIRSDMPPGPPRPREHAPRSTPPPWQESAQQDQQEQGMQPPSSSPVVPDAPRMPLRARVPPAVGATGQDGGARAAMARKVETGLPRMARWAERRQRSEPTLRWPPRP